MQTSELLSELANKFIDNSCSEADLDCILAALSKDDREHFVTKIQNYQVIQDKLNHQVKIKIDIADKVMHQVEQEEKTNTSCADQFANDKHHTTDNPHLTNKLYYFKNRLVRVFNKLLSLINSYKLLFLRPFVGQVAVMASVMLAFGFGIRFFSKDPNGDLVRNTSNNFINQQESTVYQPLQFNDHSRGVEDILAGFDSQYQNHFEQKNQQQKTLDYKKTQASQADFLRIKAYLLAHTELTSTGGDILSFARLATFKP